MLLMWNITLKKDWSHSGISSNTLNTWRCWWMCHFRFHANHGFLSKLAPMGHHRPHAGPLWAPCGLHMGRHGLLRHNGPLIKLAWATPLSEFLIRGRRIELAYSTCSEAAYPPPRFVPNHKFSMNVLLIFSYRPMGDK